ncbi:pathogenicity locus Cdd1 protein [Mucilaginibacter gracilis]|uniref:Pathogenicity locus Cdd1 protein n=1 Tax=Mucilaginibacter gracilis TaxID=423350 RepID=A0A495J4D9_9SPHI|nr:helix-hairpin-helix domain-containing protein [Mucilaginibacter gracilis]RKR83248.1 pathogenicity locus Cdd1 protein [Mucilaginibacter gracilis]
MKTPKLNLTIAEKASLKKAGILINQLKDYAADEICEILQITQHRAKQIAALIEFQAISSIGPKFAQDLVDMGIYALAQLKDKNGADLLNEHELLIGAHTDPCVEDQFRLVVHHANNPGNHKQWWHFTAERKAYRLQHGYPANRPQKKWTELEQYN